MNRKSLFQTLTALNSQHTVTDWTIHSDYLSLNLSHAALPDHSTTEFQKASDSLSLIQEYQDCLNGDIKNNTEKRQVKHHALRDLENPSFHTKEFDKACDIIATFRKNQTITDIVQIGIGGSLYGPKALYTALKTYHDKQGISSPFRCHFIANIDPLEFSSKTKELSVESTLFIIASKSGSTAETLSNIALLKEWWVEKGKPLNELPSQCISITSTDSPLNSYIDCSYQLFIDETIGGRFSTTSLIGTLISGLAFGTDCIRSLLKGAYAIDQNSLRKKVTENITLASAWTHIWHHSICNYPAKIICPYSYALSDFPAFIQQVSCESNGKSTTRSGNKTDYPTSPLIFGESGTNAQHSFFQLLHQGSHICATEFISFSKESHKNSNYTNAQDALKRNLNAQIQALSEGESHSDRHQHYDGNRPSIHVDGHSLSPESIGALIAYYENKTMFEGFILDINSFDQPGVQLGKKLASRNKG